MATRTQKIVGVVLVTVASVGVWVATGRITPRRTKVMRLEIDGRVAVLSLYGEPGERVHWEIGAPHETPVRGSSVDEPAAILDAKDAFRKMG